MKKLPMSQKLIIALAASFVALCAASQPVKAQSGSGHFITALGDQLFDGSQPFRFISFNIPNLHLIEDDFPFTSTNAWRLPDQFEINDALATMKQMGGTVARTY